VSEFGRSILPVVPGAGTPCPDEGRKAEAETTAESGGRRAPLPVDGREPLLLEKGGPPGGKADPLGLGKELPEGNASALAAEKAPFPDEKGRVPDEKLPEAMRWWAIPLPFPPMEGVGGEGVWAGGERRTYWGLEEKED
jgi:hypothetical protein